MPQGMQVSQSASPHDKLSATPPEPVAAHRYRDYAALSHHTSQEDHFRNTYGQSHIVSTPLRGTSVGTAGFVEISSGSRRHHQDTTRSPSAPRQPPPAAMPQRHLTQTRRPVSATATRTNNRCADAIAFQYYARQRQQREASANPSGEAPLALANGTLHNDAGRNGHTPPTPPTHSGAGRPPLRTLRASAQGHSATPPPLMRTTANESAMADAAVSLSSSCSTPCTSRGGTTATRRDEPSPLNNTQPPTQRRQHTAATKAPPRTAARWSESRQLLRFYSGFGVTPPAGREGCPAVHDDPRDGRALLLEALQGLMDLVHRTETAAAALAGSVGGGAARRSPAVRDPTEATPVTESAGQRAAKSGASGERPSRGPAGGARIPRQLRTRVMASRVGAGGTRTRSSGSRPASLPRAAQDSSQPVTDFMKTIKPPRRHGLGAALHPPSTPPSPRSPLLQRLAEAEAAAHAAGTAASPDVDAEALISKCMPLVEDTSAPAPPQRVVPLVCGHADGGLSYALSAAIASSELSPGAAAARRVYWEQQQQQQQQGGQGSSVSGEMQHLSAFPPPADNREAAAVVVPRYPESVSTDVGPQHTPTPDGHPLVSVSLDDSVLRSDAHSLPLVRPLVEESATMTIDAPLAAEHDVGVAVPLTGQLTPAKVSEAARRGERSCSPLRDVTSADLEHSEDAAGVHVFLTDMSPAVSPIPRYASSLSRSQDTQGSSGPSERGGW